MKRTLHYIKLWLHGVRLSIKRARLYKTEVISRVIRGIMIFALQTLVVESVFSQGDLVAGVTRPEYYLIIGTYNLVNYLGWAIFNVNIRRLQERIVKGELDYPLTKPTSSLFEIVLGEFFIDDLIPIVGGFTFIGFYLYWVPAIALVNVVLYLLAVLLGLVVWFSLHLFVGSLGFIYVGNRFLDLLTGIGNMARAPSSIWGKFELFFYVLLPTALVSTFPADVLSGNNTVVNWAIAILVNVVLLAVAVSFWNYALKRYESGN